MEDLKKGVASINTADDWKRALEVFSDLHQYSFLNTVWLCRQNPNVTAVASYKKWEEKGIHVNKGEKAMRVFAPLIVTDRDGTPNAEGKLPQKVVGFKTVPVFDLSQTDGFGKLDTMAGRWTKEMEKAGIAPEGMTDALTEKATKLGFTVSYRDDLPGTAQGVTRFNSNEIVVNANLSDLKRAQVLSHEIGHIMMGHGDDHEHYHTGEGGERARMEVEAESVAYVISRGWGISSDDDNTSSFEYVASWDAKNGQDTDDLLTNVTNKLTKIRNDLPMPVSAA
jgi:antirestriction protein ArdC